MRTKKETQCISSMCLGDLFLLFTACKKKKLVKTVTWEEPSRSCLFRLLILFFLKPTRPTRRKDKMRKSSHH